MNALHDAICQKISGTTGQPFTIADSRPLGGGCIHDAACVTGEDGRRFFVKQNDRSRIPSFEAEAHALARMAETRTIRVPEPLGTCADKTRAALVLEFIPMGGSGSQEAMGRQLARLHRSTAKAFGWPHDNWIGDTIQLNGFDDDWLRFYRDRRLKPQIEWARKKSLPLGKAEALLEALPAFFKGYHPVPSLLHGDLWGGNADFTADGEPVVFDPAAYYGDREADLAMTEMFGGFGSGFYKGYDAEWPLNPGYRTRKQLYILYHVLNHFNIFGGGYGSQAGSMVATLLKSVS